MNRASFSVMALGLFAFVGCKSEAPKVEPVKTPPPASAAVTPPPVEKTPAAPDKIAVILSRASLRRAPTEDGKIDDPDGSGKKVNNWMALLHRGERIDVMQQQGDWTQVRASDGSEGWVSAKSVLEGESIQEATLLAPAKTFNRPDLVAVSKTELEPGTLLFVQGEKDPFTQVNHRYQSTAWIMTSALTTDDADVQVARMIERARYLVEKKNFDEAKQLLEVAQGQLGTAKLLSVLQEVVAPAADALPEVAPAEDVDPAEDLAR